MKKTLIAGIFFSVVAFTAIVAAKHFWRGEILPAAEVCAKWGEAILNVEKFKDGDEKLRSKMACSLLKNQKLYIGKTRSDIRRAFGDHDGFYFSDMFPAYMIETAADRSQNSWQLVFFLDRKELISEIAVHKNCCDR